METTSPRRERCPQCYRERRRADFVDPRGTRRPLCSRCRTTYSNWSTKTTDEKRASAMKRTARAACGLSRAQRVLRRAGERDGLPASLAAWRRAMKTKAAKALASDTYGITSGLNPPTPKEQTVAELASEVA